MPQQGDDNTNRNQGALGSQSQQPRPDHHRQQEQGGDNGGQMGGGTDADTNPGNFKNDPERASEAGRKGGESSGGGSR